MEKEKISSTEQLSQVSIRFAGDSGDGIQLTGERFTTTSAIMGEEVATLTDFPAEIRAPIGTVGGVSGFQLSFGSGDVFTAGDEVHALVVMNPAALKINLMHLKKKGILIINKDSFEEKNLKKAGYGADPREDGTLKNYQLVEVGITSMTKEALKETGLKPKDIERCKNFFALGLTFWLYQRDLKPTEEWLDVKFAKKPDVANANKLALKAGWIFGEATEALVHSYEIDHKDTRRSPGTYRHVTGNKAVALGLLAASKKMGRSLFLGSYPITPATEVLQELSSMKHLGVTTFQAEDEIAAIGSAIGASFAGHLSATSTSGPGFALKSEFLNLAVITELPLVVVNVQRCGPSTGLPTKTEQADLFQALWGRNGESPMVVLAASSPVDCFKMAFEAARLAVKYMTPVVLLSDNYLANGSQVWKIPDVETLPEIKPGFDLDKSTPAGPFSRDKETMARPWISPGRAGSEHRLGGLEKEPVTGNVSFDADGHEKMVHERADKIALVANDYPPLPFYGSDDADLLVIGWGSTYGAIRWAVENLSKAGTKVAFTHLKYLNPLPNDLKPLMNKYSKILVPENNMGQMYLRLGGEFNDKLIPFNKNTGTPFKEKEIEEKILEILNS